MPMTRGTACAGKTPKTKGRRRQVKGAHGVLPDRDEVFRESVKKDAMQIKKMAESL